MQTAFIGCSVADAPDANAGYPRPVEAAIPSTDDSLPLSHARSAPLGVLDTARAFPVLSIGWSALAYFTAAVLLRAGLFGDPVVHLDEQFYLLVGNRMLHGALPYVDIWDRKPIGLFLIYAFASLWRTHEVFAYQLLATASVATTALAIERIARRFAPPRGAFLSGLCYLLYLNIFNCAGGESPVFYNMPMALAGLLLLKAAGDEDDSLLARRGIAIMALVGMAIQIKYSAVFEGVAFGLVLLVRAYTIGWPRQRIVGAGVLWIATALLPTAVALGAYGAIGQGHAFFDANFLSIFARHIDQGQADWRLTKEALALAPLVLAVTFGAKSLAPKDPHASFAPLHVTRIWVAAAVFGFLVFGCWYDHYVAPLLVPLCALAAPALAETRRSTPAKATLVLGVLGAALVPALNYRVRGNAAEVEAMAALVRPELDQGCLYAFDDLPVLYRVTGSCIPTAFPFPSHLSSTIEHRSLGVDVTAEVARIMRSHPSVVVMRKVPDLDEADLATRALVERFLAEHYEHYASATVGEQRYLLYRLRR